MLPENHTLARRQKNTAVGGLECYRELQSANAKEVKSVQDKRDAGGKVVTLPNAITSLRLIGSPGLVVLAFWQQPEWLALLAAILVITEWLDGLLARALHAESSIGARLDTVADAFFYCSLLAAVAILIPDRIRNEGYWIGAAIGSYLASWVASLVKFRCLPSYHTWMAKGAWFIVGPGIIMLVLGWSPWILRAAMCIVVVTNVEAVLITLTLAKPRVDVPSIWHAKRIAKREANEYGDDR